MAKIQLDDVTNILTAASTLNSNNTKIEAAIENTLSRDGTSPNEMNADLDMNNHRIYNLPRPLSPSEPLRLADSPPLLEITTYVEEAKGYRDEAAISADSAAASAAEAQEILEEIEGLDLTFVQVGTGAVPRTYQDKERDIINVLDFGAVGDGVADDSVAIQTAIDACIATGGNVLPTLHFGAQGGTKKSFRIENTLNLTGLRLNKWTINLGSNTLIGATNGQPIFDMLDSEHIVIMDGAIYGDPSAPPTYGIQYGRGIYDPIAGMGRGAAYMSLYRVNFTGAYSGACVINSASEIFRADKCNFWNSHTSIGANCVTHDARRRIHLTSQFFTVDVPNDTYSSHNDVLYTNCTFERISGVANQIAIAIFGKSFAHHFVNCYGQAQLGQGMYLDGDHTQLVADIHWEAATIVNNYLIATSVGNCFLRDCVFKEYFLFATGSMFVTTGGAGAAFMHGCEVTVGESFNVSVPVFAQNGTFIQFTGVIKLGATSVSHDLSDLDYLFGHVYGIQPRTSFTRPAGQGHFFYWTPAETSVASYGSFTNIP